MQLAERVIKERNLTCILITHQLKEALNYGQRLIQLQNGKILRDYQEDKKNKLSIKELFSCFGD